MLITKPKRVILDPTGIYSPEPGSIVISTEIEWVEKFFISEGTYWIKGKFLCNWTQEWLSIWNLSAYVIEKDPPIILLRKYVPSIPINWDDSQIGKWASKLEACTSNHPIAELLEQATGHFEGIWFSSPSSTHLAHWLSVEVPQEYLPLEAIWQEQIAQNCIDSGLKELADFYLYKDKLGLLKTWLGLANINNLTNPSILGLYPLPVPSKLQNEFDNYWEKLILTTKGNILTVLDSNKHADIKRIASIAYKILIGKKTWITKENVSKLSRYLSYEQCKTLQENLPPYAPEKISSSLSLKEVLKWATESYMPYRYWEKVICDSATNYSKELAESFVDWILENYPKLKLDPVDESALNYAITSYVKNLCQKYTVLWIVIDGLGWLDHKELIKIITEVTYLKIESAISPLFSILPTKTEYAKWSLYAQLLTSNSSWSVGSYKGFERTTIEKRYTKSNIHLLCEDLRRNIYKLYCWDTDELDKVYHTERDLQHLYKVQRPEVLRKIAKQIEFFVQSAPNPEEVKVVICSDHGQMIGAIPILAEPIGGLTSYGRMVERNVSDKNLVVLEAGVFGLPHDISVVRGEACLGAINLTIDKKALGIHGGLFPEEVVVGFSVLSPAAQRLPVTVLCQGEGKAKQSGELIITINNPNSIPLTDLMLYIDQIPYTSSGMIIEERIPANGEKQLRIKIRSWPELSIKHEGNLLLISGKLEFRFSETELSSTMIEKSSTIKIQQIFRSGMDIEEFL